MKKPTVVTLKGAKSLEARIHDCYGDLPPTEKRLADLLLSFPGNLVTYSAGELARMAGTSNAAATRLFQRLGYKDFSEARRIMRSARTWGSSVYVSRPENTSGQGSKTVSSHITRETENLSRTLEGIRPDFLRDAADALVNARKVVVGGFRNSRIFAEYFFQQLSLTRDDVRLIPSAGQTMGEQLAGLGEDDILVVLGFRRRMSMVENLMLAAKRRRCRILLIGDPSVSSLPHVATWTIVCQVHAEFLFDSYTAPMSVLNLLCLATFRAGMPASYARLREIETLHDELDELDPLIWPSSFDPNSEGNSDP